MFQLADVVQVVHVQPNLDPRNEQLQLALDHSDLVLAARPNVTPGKPQADLLIRGSTWDTVCSWAAEGQWAHRKT